VTTPDRDSITYAGAIEELEAILVELEDDRLDVDHLGERVARAAELIRLCRQRIASTRLESSASSPTSTNRRRRPGRPPAAEPGSSGAPPAHPHLDLAHCTRRLSSSGGGHVAESRGTT
jgi:exodeoxyribonuclease VII small subunit